MTASHIPYGRQDIRDDDVDAVNEVLRSDWLTQGPACTLQLGAEESLQVAIQDGYGIILFGAFEL